MAARAESGGMKKQIEPYAPKTLRRDWGEEIFIAETPAYLGKVLLMNKGTAGGLQYHTEKDETFFLFSGRAIVRSDNGRGQLNVTMMLPGQSFHIPPGAVHQVEALEDCVLFEASTPHYDDRVRCEGLYGLPEGGGLPTTR
jgi:mannose-6-phosphate isomerase